MTVTITKDICKSLLERDPWFCCVQEGRTRTGEVLNMKGSSQETG